jgi:hypothetical protein
VVAVPAVDAERRTLHTTGNVLGPERRSLLHTASSKGDGMTDEAMDRAAMRVYFPDKADRCLAMAYERWNRRYFDVHTSPSVCPHPDEHTDASARGCPRCMRTLAACPCVQAEHRRRAALLEEADALVQRLVPLSYDTLLAR